MKDGPRQLNMPKMPRALRHSLTTCLALEIPVNGTHPRIHKTAILGLVGSFVHDFGMLNLCDGNCFLERG